MPIPATCPSCRTETSVADEIAASGRARCGCGVAFDLIPKAISTSGPYRRQLAFTVASTAPPPPGVSDLSGEGATRHVALGRPRGGIATDLGLGAVTLLAGGLAAWYAPASFGQLGLLALAIAFVAASWIIRPCFENLEVVIRDGRLTVTRTLKRLRRRRSFPVSAIEQLAIKDVPAEDVNWLGYGVEVVLPLGRRATLFTRAYPRQTLEWLVDHLETGLKRHREIETSGLTSP